MSSNRSDQGGDARALVLTRVFDAPPDAVFALWSDPAHVQAWWHPKDFTTPVFEMDFRVGGRDVALKEVRFSEAAQ